MSRRFARRSAETELMDTELTSLEDYRACLEDLAVVNTLTLTHRPILAWLDRAMQDIPRETPVRILDVGYGYGDLLRRIASWSASRGWRADLIGIDLNPWSEPIARAATDPALPVTFLTGNVFDFEPDRPIDFIVSSQTAHHLSDHDLVALVQWMERVAGRGWFIADLHRHAVPYHSFRFLSRLAGWHRFVQHDGPVSIARSFRRPDWEKALHSAGLAPGTATIRWHVPFRLCVSRLR